MQDRDICASFRVHVSLQRTLPQANTPGSSEVLKGHAELVETLLMFELAQSHDAIFSMDVGIFYRMV